MRHHTAVKPCQICANFEMGSARQAVRVEARVAVGAVDVAVEESANWLCRCNGARNLASRPVGSSASLSALLVRTRLAKKQASPCERKHEKTSRGMFPSSSLRRQFECRVQENRQRLSGIVLAPYGSCAQYWPAVRRRRSLAVSGMSTLRWHIVCVSKITATVLWRQFGTRIFAGPTRQAEPCFVNFSRLIFLSRFLRRMLFSFLPFVLF